MKIEQLDRKKIGLYKQHAIWGIDAIWENQVASKNNNCREVRNDSDHEDRDQQEQNSRELLLALNDAQTSSAHRFRRECWFVFSPPNDHKVDNHEN